MTHSSVIKWSMYNWIHGNIFQKMLVSTSLNPLLAGLLSLFEWVFSKSFWLQAIQISNIVLSIYNVVTSGPLLKLHQAARSQEKQNEFYNPSRTFNTTLSNNPEFSGKIFQTLPQLLLICILNTQLNWMTVWEKSTPNKISYEKSILAQGGARTLDC